VESRDFKDPFENGNFPQQLDLPRLKQAQSGGAFWSVFAPCPENGADFSDENYASSMNGPALFLAVYYPC
jgi:membrane dipeptidase